MSLNVIFKIVAVLLLMSVIVLVLPRILYPSCNCSMSIRGKYKNHEILHAQNNFLLMICDISILLFVDRT